MSFASVEREDMLYQPIGRLATIGDGGQPRIAPVGFRSTGDGSIAIRGHNLSATKKWGNVERNPRVSFVIDDLPSTDPWVARGVEIRGHAHTESQTRPDGSIDEQIIVTPARIITWGLGRGQRTSRDVAPVEARPPVPAARASTAYD